MLTGGLRAVADGCRGGGRVVVPAPEEHGVHALEQPGRDDAERTAHDHVPGEQDVADRAGVAQAALHVPLVGQHPPAAASRDHAVAGVEEHEGLVEVLGARPGGEHPGEQVVVLHVAQVGVATGVERELPPEDHRRVVDRVVQAHPGSDLLVGARVAAHSDDVVGAALELEHRRPDEVEVVLLDGLHLRARGGGGARRRRSRGGPRSRRSRAPGRAPRPGRCRRCAAAARRAVAGWAAAAAARAASSGSGTGPSTTTRNSSGGRVCPVIEATDRSSSSTVVPW